MDYNCPGLKSLLDQAEDGVIPWDLKTVIEDHIETCRPCSAKLSNFIQIDNILTNTVYGKPARDKYLGFLFHVTGQKYIWGQEGEIKTGSQPRKLTRLMLKILVGFVVAAGLGVSGLVVFGRSGCIGKMPEPEQTADILPDRLPENALITGNENRAFLEDTMDTINQTASNPGAIYQKLNRMEKTVDRQAPSSSGEGDSSRLKVLGAELAALRDAVSRTPGDRSLVTRAMDKYRQLLAEQRRFNRPARARDYYNLGYMHYLNKEYPQTAIVTEEGIRMVRMGPVEYLHHLKAMAHYRIAEQAVQPLPPDTSSEDSARLSGALLRAELDAEGRQQAITELRRSISEFKQLLDNPELTQSATEWILKCSQLIEQISESP
jgi:hypothetical protein